MFRLLYSKEKDWLKVLYTFWPAFYTLLKFGTPQTRINRVAVGRQVSEGLTDFLSCCVPKLEMVIFLRERFFFGLGLFVCFIDLSIRDYTSKIRSQVRRESTQVAAFNRFLQTSPNTRNQTLHPPLK